MTKKITPVGKSLLIYPLPPETYTTDSGIQFSDTDIISATVMEVSADDSEVYKKGDKIRYVKGAGIDQYYKGKKCEWINSGGFPTGHVMAIISEENDEA